jgi:hypothetical protein
VCRYRMSLRCDSAYGVRYHVPHDDVVTTLEGNGKIWKKSTRREPSVKLSAARDKREPILQASL